MAAEGRGALKSPQGRAMCATSEQIAANRCLSQAFLNVSVAKALAVLPAMP